VVRAFFSYDFMPAVHHSSFNVAAKPRTYADDESGTVAGFLRQAHDLAPGIDALVQLSVSEGVPIVLEGVHLLPEIPNPSLRRQAVAVRVLLTARDEDAHRAHFQARAVTTPRSADRYLEAFHRIRVLQDYLIAEAGREGVPIIDEPRLDAALARVTEVVLDTVGAEGQDPAAESVDAATKLSAKRSGQ
jgi:2-phosphoglycerate kinase